jgi:predicted DNA-binding protein
MAAIETMAATKQATTIALAKSTKERLRRLAEKGETYDEVVLRLIHRAAIKEMDDRWNRILEDEEFTPLEDLE